MSTNSANCDNKATLSNNNTIPKQDRNQDQYQDEHEDGDDDDDDEDDDEANDQDEDDFDPDESLPPLFIAIQNNDVDAIIDILSSPNFNPNVAFVIDKNNHGLIRYILDSSLPELLPILIATNIIDIEPILEECDNLAPIGYIIKNGKIDMLRALLEVDRDIIGIGPYTPPSNHPYWPEEQLAEEGYSLYQITLQITNNDTIKYQMIDALYKYGFDINDDVYEFYPALFTTCHMGNLNDFKYLLKLKADPDATSDVDDTILIAASYSGSIELVDYIIGLRGNNNNNNGHDTNEDDDEDEENNHDDEDEENNHDDEDHDEDDYERDPFSIDYENDKGRNAIAAAIEYGHIPLVKHLMNKYGADIGFINHLGHTGLHLCSFAIHDKTRAMLEFLYPLVIPDYYSIENVDFGGDTALSAAVESGNKIAFDFLIEMKANQHVIRNDGGNLLHIAAEFSLHNQIGIDLALSIKDLDINLENENGHTPIQLAVANQNVRAVKSFLQHPNIDIHICLSSPLEVETNDGRIFVLQENTNLLFIAIITNNVEIVDLLLHAGIDFKETGPNGDEVLDEAIIYDSIDVVKYFINHPNPTCRLDIIKSTTIDTPYHLAFSSKSRRVLDWLMKNNIDGINLPSRHDTIRPYTIFQRSMLHVHFNIVDKLLAAKADPRATTPQGENILHLLASSTSENLNKIDYVLSKWPDLLHTRTNDNHTPLSLAIITQNISNMVRLHQMGADLTQSCAFGNDIDNDTTGIIDPNNKGVTTLHLAALVQHVETGKEMVEYILSNTNYTIDQLSLTSYTPLLYATLHGNQGMMEYFWSHGANRIHKTQSGLNVLDCAIYSNNITMVKWLLSQTTNQGELYFNLNNIDEASLQSQRTHIHNAIIFDRLEVAKVLVELKANPFIFKDVDIVYLASSLEMEEWCKELLSQRY